MVKKITKINTWWECKVCGKYHNKKKDALVCEKRPPLKIKVGKPPGKWKKGDMVIVHVHDLGDHLAQISGEKIKEHDIVPVLSFLDMDEREYDDWRDDIVIITKEIKERILRWADLLKKEEP